MSQNKLFKSSSKKRSKTARRRRLFEHLESRLLLTGGLYSNIQIDDTRMLALQDGVVGISGFGDQVADSGDFSSPLKFLRAADQSQLTMGGIAPVGQIIADELASPFERFLLDAIVSERTTDAAVAYLSTLPGVVSVDGGHTTSPTDEIRFEIHFRHEEPITEFNLEFGPGVGGNFGRVSTVHLDAVSILDLQFEFGVMLDSDLNSEQSFFVRNLDLDVSLSANANADLFTLNVGILQVSAPDVSFNFLANLHVGQNDPEPDAFRQLVLAELNGYDIAELASTTISDNYIDTTFDLTASLGSWTVSGSPRVRAIGQLIGIDPVLEFNPDFDQLRPFFNLTTEDLVNGTEQLGSWLTALTDTELLEVDIPFTKSAALGDVYDVGSAFGSIIESMRDPTGAPSFTSAQAFPYTGANGIGFDPATNQLRYIVRRNLPSQSTSSRSNHLSLDSVLGLSESVPVQIDADGSIMYEVAIDLDGEGIPVDERMRFTDLLIQGEILPSVAGIAGRAAYGGLGIEYADASVTGQYDYELNIGDAAPTVGGVSLSDLFFRLTDPETLLETPAVFEGASELRLSGLSVLNNLFSIPADALLVASVSNLADGVVDVIVENSPDLARFENITFETVTQSLTEAILGTESWSTDPDADPLATIGQSVEDFVDVRQRKIVEAINEGKDEVAQMEEAGRVILQDVPGFLENLTVATSRGVVTFTSNIFYRHLRNSFELYFDADVSSTGAAVDVGMGFESLQEYTDHRLVDETTDFVGINATSEAEVSQSMSIGLELDVSDPDSPTAYLNNSTEVETLLFMDSSSSPTALSMDGATGSTGLQLTDGRVVLARDLVNPNAAAPATFRSRVSGFRVPLSDLNSFNPARTTIGKLLVDFAVVPDSSGTATPERLIFQIDDLNTPLTSTVLVSSPSFPDLHAGADLPNQLQAVPPSFDEIFGDLAATLRGQVFGQDFPLIGDALDGPANFLEKIRIRLRNVFSTLTDFSAASVETKIETAIQRLLGRPGDYVTVDLTVPTDIGFTIQFTGAPIEEILSTETDLGLPALGASLSADLEVVGSYDFSVTIIVSVVDGIYVDPTSESIRVDLDIGLTGTATGRLGFLDVIATAGPSDPSCGAFHAEFTVGLQDVNSDGKLKLNELASGGIIDSAATGLRGCAGIRLDFEATVSEWLPSVVTDLSIDWNFDGTNLTGDVPEITFGNVGVKVGQFLSQTIAPFLLKIEQILEPIDPILRLLDTPLPVLDQFMDPISLLSIAEGLIGSVSIDSNFVKSIQSIIDMLRFLVTLNELANAVTVDMNSQAVIEIGSLNFGGSRSPQFDARLPVLDVGVLAEAIAADDWEVQLESPSAAPNFAASLTTTPSKIHFPIFENPTGVFEWLFGFGEAELIAWELPSVFLSIPFDIPIPIFPGVFAKLYGGIETSFSITVGIDTYGVSRFRQTGQAKDLLAGFYVSDTDQPDGSGDDIPEMPIEGKVIAALGVGVDLGPVAISASVGGGLYASLDLDLIDHDGDGKLRGHEFASPDGCIAVRGSVGVTLEVQYAAGPISDDVPLVRGELGSFNDIIACPDFDGSAPPPARLASLNSATGELTLLVGELADQRDVRQDETEEIYLVNRFNRTIRISAFGYQQEFDADDVTSIVAHAGTGKDRILIDQRILKPVFLYGDEGDDYLKGGGASDTLEGGDGDDFILGGAGGDTIRGGDGADELQGEEGNDFIYGDDGDDTIEGGTENDVIETGEGFNWAFGNEGVDTITGGSGRDAIYGGSEGDTIHGGGGENVLMGEDGGDTITGGPDNDLIDGGGGYNILLGMEGKDRIYGGQDGNDIDSGDGADFVQGGAEIDVIRGGRGLDTLRGGDGADEMYGGFGDDLMFGEGGEDFIFGQDGVDTIEGGTERDSIDGGDGDDIIYGGQQGDTIEGGPGNDQLYGQQGGDTIYGGSNSLNEDTSAADFVDNDTIDGGDDDDYLAGGFGRDLIYGQDGADTLQGNEDVDVIDGGDDNDTIYGDDAPDHQRGGIAAADELYGKLGDDEIFGGDGDDFIRGGKGDDTLWGERGLDRLFGDEDDDTLDGGPQADEIDGSKGNDHLRGSGDNDHLYGNLGIDTIEGNDGDDFIRGNSQPDFLYGDDGDDDIAGNEGNDTIRGGADDDVLLGNEGDDLLLGHTGNDTIDGDEGDDVLYGFTGIDHLRGQLGNDRLFGELGDDTLEGNEGDDVIEGGPGDDTITGDDGNDQLYGDNGVDDISGGLGDDFIQAGNGIGDYLRGDDGDDTIVGSDDGTDDPKLDDTIYFGDRIEGGFGNDTIDGLGGADIIDGGLGLDIIRGGVHGDSILGGPATGGLPTEDEDQLYGQDGDDVMDGGLGDDVIGGGGGTNTINDTLGTNTVDTAGDPLPPPVEFSQGPERRGNWAELSGSATQSGLSRVGGFEESVLATGDGVYVAWVDWRNGNSEIYLAHHRYETGDWMIVFGASGKPSAGGGGVSDDAQQSRRPVIFIPPNEQDVYVAWTSIAEDGSSNIEIARQSDDWGRVANPGQTGNADHAKFVAYSGNSGLLAWIDSTTPDKLVAVSQFINERGCFVGFTAASEVSNSLPDGMDVNDFDLDAADFRAAIAYSYGSTTDHDIDIVVTNQYGVLTENQLCPAVPNITISVTSATGWRVVETITEDDTTEPTIGLQLLATRSQGQNEVELETDLYVAWSTKSDRFDQVDGVAIRQGFNAAPQPAEQLIPQLFHDNSPRIHANTVSETRGYAAKPELAVSNIGANLAWMDDGVFLGDNESHLFVLSNFGNHNYPFEPYTLSELQEHDASGQGISSTGGSLQSLSIDVPREGLYSTSPYVVWTEAKVRAADASTLGSTSGVYLRVRQSGASATDDLFSITKLGLVLANLLDNDDSQFGEFSPQLSHFEDIEFNSELEITSELGALIKVLSNGEFSYDPRGVRRFMELRSGQSLSETFTYKSYDGIFYAEALIIVTVNGIDPEFDFGDLPNSYATTLVVNGPRHRVGGGLFLGATVNADVDGSPDPLANVDIGDDGVTIPSLLIPGFAATMSIVASQAGLLDAFIDFDGNGQFDAADRITPVAGLAVATGANQLKIDVPANAVSGTSAARFRLSTVGGLGPTGAAEDGEVEDYRTTLLLPPTGSARLLPDPTRTEGNLLLVRGTTGNDLIVLTIVNGETRVTINGVLTRLAAATTQLVAFGLAGDDDIRINDIELPGYIDGGVGNDTLRGGNGPDRIFGRAGDDTIYGRNGDDVVFGGVGNDVLYSNSGIGLLFGQLGNDKLYGNGVLVGGTGNDELNANGPRNLLFGGLGQDLLNGANANQGDLFVTGPTLFDEDESKLLLLRSEWADSLSSVTNRIAHLDGSQLGGLNGTIFLNHTTVQVESLPDVAVNYGSRIPTRDDWLLFSDGDVKINPGGIVTMIGSGSQSLNQSIGTQSFALKSTETARHNPFLPADVNDDGVVTPVDVLNIVDVLYQISRGVDALATTQLFVDVNSDGVASPLDALLVIDGLRKQAK
jgi:Ca2+-binding RTX toxin-like protein